MTVQRDSKGRFKSKGIQKSWFLLWTEELNADAIRTISNTQDEVIDELNALKAWKEQHEAKHKGIEMRKDKKEQLGDLLFDWKYHKYLKNMTIEEVREKILELLK